MRLKHWLKQEGKSVRQMADDLGELDTIVRKWVYGQRQPSLPNAVAIEEYTGGAVTARDLLLTESPAADRIAA